MSEENQEQITDPKEREVFKALANPEWDFRTITGISKNIGIDEVEVRAILEKYPSLVRKSPVPDERGRDLYTLRTRGLAARESLAITQRALTKSVR